MKYLKEYIDWEDWDEEDKQPIGNELFTQFLIDNDIYDKWLEYTLSFKGLKSVDDINYLIKEFKLKNSDIFTLGFAWRHTSEGYGYWRKLNKKWLKLCKIARYR